MRIIPQVTGKFDEDIKKIGEKLDEIITFEVGKLKNFYVNKGNNEINDKIAKLETLRDNLLNEIKKLIFID